MAEKDGLKVNFHAGSKSPTRQPPAPKRFGGGASPRYGDGA
jgi:hypothetical protein